MNKTIKYFLLGLGILLVFFVTLFFVRRRSVGYVINYTKKYSYEKKNIFWELRDYLKREKYSNIENLNIGISYSIKNREFIYLDNYDDSIEVSENLVAPYFMKDLLVNDITLEIELVKDGFFVNDVFATHDFRNCSIRFFFNNHNLDKNEKYENYYISNLDEPNNYKEQCFIINSNCVLLISP